MDMFMKKERKGEDDMNSIYHKIWWFLKFHSPLNGNVFFFD
jgi:hypothetical protein